MGGARVAFLGLGAMGLGMATSLLRAGFRVQGYDVSTTLQLSMNMFGDNGYQS
jgi:3-hydroxyisobutyrate dehydrogenase-like beta-hydroxyacid dehydrogenase